RERWSRTLGWLGPGAWDHLSGLSIVVAGCGRTGSELATFLARDGCRLTLVDPDRIELHNLGEMATVTDADLGRPKAAAPAEGPARGRPWLAPRVRAIPAPLADPAARAAVRECAVLVSCADNDAARLAAALLAVRCHLVHLDVGTAVLP